MASATIYNTHLLFAPKIVFPKSFKFIDSGSETMLQALIIQCLHSLVRSLAGTSCPCNSCFTRNASTALHNCYAGWISALCGTPRLDTLPVKIPFIVHDWLCATNGTPTARNVSLPLAERHLKAILARFFNDLLGASTRSLPGVSMTLQTCGHQRRERGHASRG